MTSERPRQNTACKTIKEYQTIERGIEKRLQNGTFRVCFYFGTDKSGKPRRRYKNFPTLREARKALMEFKAGGAVPQKKAKMLFIECVGEYIEQAQIERTTRMGYSIIANRIAKTPLADIQLGKIRRADIGEYVRKLQTETQLSNATINKDLFLIGLHCPMRSRWIISKQTQHIPSQN